MGSLHTHRYLYVCGKKQNASGSIWSSAILPWSHNLEYDMIQCLHCKFLVCETLCCFKYYINPFSSAYPSLSYPCWGNRQGTPWIVWQFVTGLTQRDTRYNPTACICLDCGRNWEFLEGKQVINNSLDLSKAVAL